MKLRLGSLIDRLVRGMALVHWQRAARRAARADASGVLGLRRAALRLRTVLDGVLREADARLGVQRAGPIPRPPGTDMAWRPPVWRAPLPQPALAAPPGRVDLCEGVTLYHDCPRREMLLRQEQRLGARVSAPFGLRLEVFAFAGSYLSLAVTLPEQAVEGLGMRHIIAVQVTLTQERAAPVFARLNVRHGPNLEQIVREIDLLDGGVVEGGVSAVREGTGLAEFDLAYSQIDQRRVEGAWIDVMFGEPAMNAFRLDDMTVTRRPRAAI